MTEAIGWALGPGTTEEAFDFVTADIDRLKVGEFVYYTVDEPQILCRIRERERIVSNKNVIDAVEDEIPRDDKKSSRKTGDIG